MNHVSSSVSAYPRESGILIGVDSNGDELRLHIDARGFWHGHRWRIIEGRWAGPVAYGMTSAEFQACAAAVPS